MAMLFMQTARAQPSSEPNTTCPVMTGEPVKDSVYEDYNGQRIYFCCTKCQAKFRANPAKYLANLQPSNPGTGAGAAPRPGDPKASADTPNPQSTIRNPQSQEAPPLLSRLARFVGRLHPLTVHFPVALLIVAGLLTATTATRHSRGARDAARLCTVLGAFGAIAAAGMGWLNARYEHGGLDQDTTNLSIHRWLGLAVAAAAFIAAMISLRSYKREVRTRQLPKRWRPTHALAGLVLAILVGITGHFGGLTAYGTNYLSEAFSSAGSPAPNGPPSAPTRSPAADKGPASHATAAPPSAPAAVAKWSTLPDSIQTLLFNSSDPEVIKARRAARLAEVTPPPGPFTPADPSSQPGEDRPNLSVIDQFIRQSWAKAGLPEYAAPPPLCDDQTFLRRVYLDVIGVIPTIEESDRFLSDTAPDKRGRLIDELLARDQDYADHWTPFWEDALGSSSAQLQGGVPTRGNYREWINDAFRENRPFDLFAAQLIDTDIPGAKKPETAEANSKKSRVSYIRFETHTDTLQSAATVAQVFLGTSMKCASCHSHFENDEWPQKRFLAFAGMFGPHDLELIRCEKKSGEFIPARFAFELPGALESVPDDLDGRLRRAAQLLTDPQNPRFAKAIVNRLWKRYLGLGLFEPIDDFRLSVPPSHPQLLDWLAYDFMSHDYDLKHTVRLILTSRTYQTAYSAALEDHFDIARKTDPRYFRSPTLRRLTAEQVIDSLRVAATQELDPKTRFFHQDRSTALSRALGKPASRNEISTQRPDDNAVVQALELLNSEEFNSLVYSSAILADLARASTPPPDAPMPHASLPLLDPASSTHESQEAPATRAEQPDQTLTPDPLAGSIATLYRALLTRPPRTDELALAHSFLQSAIPSSAPAAPPREIILIDDDTPPTAHLVGDWKWVTSPVSTSKRAHQQTSMGKPKQHYTYASTGSPVSPLDTLFVDVYLDKDKPPREVMIQWNDGTDNDGGWPHRAFWGEDLIDFGKGPATVRERLGDLPETGRWVHLEIPAARVGFITPGRVVGMSFDQHGGTVTFDNAGLIHHESGPQYQALGDLLWALASSPEFHYIR
jgi:uncharacterized membrane protein/YHS domain-containing protein